jgi:hypothetical protein
VLVRDVSAYPLLDRCLRISIGTPEENDKLLAALDRAWRRADGSEKGAKSRKTNETNIRVN